MLNFLGGLIILGGLWLIAGVSSRYPAFGNWPIVLGVPLVIIGILAVYCALRKAHGDRRSPD